jgi:hypothetical protein
MHSGDMQIVEVTDFAVRSSVLRLTRPGTPLQYEIFPMIHTAEPQFYAAVADRLRRAGLIVAEGVGAPEQAPAAERDLEIASLDWPGLEIDAEALRVRRGGLAASAITASYRIPARFGSLGLVEENIDYDQLGVPVLYPDMTDAAFDDGFRALPAWQRALIVTALPLFGLHQAAFGSRRALARHLALDDTDWPARQAALEKMGGVAKLIGEQRDHLLLTALDAVHDTCCGDPITVAVVYGAFHVPPLLQRLRSRHGYSVRGAEWLTVFDLDQPRRDDAG